MSEINLLHKTNSISLRQEQAVAIFRRVSIVILAATAFLSIVVFILVLQSPVAKSKQTEETLIATLTRLSTKISRHVIIQERLSSIASIFAARNSYEKVLQILIDQIPSSVTLTSIDISAKSIQLSGNSPSLDDTNAFLSNITMLKEKKQFVKSVILKSFVLQSTSSKYFFTLAITLL